MYWGEVEPGQNATVPCCVVEPASIYNNPMQDTGVKAVTALQNGDSSVRGLCVLAD
jgi:hypothetical protein